MKIILQTTFFVLIIISSLAAQANQQVSYKTDVQTNDQTDSHLDIKPLQPTCDESNNVDLKQNDIFDLTDPETIFLHHWANFLHIKTKPATIKNESAFFFKKCDVNDQDLLELERHLRKQKYIRDAVVKVDENNKIIVETFDNWSLMPTIDFGRKGGKNKFAIGLKDRNLLGLGIDTEIEYYTNDQRTGYKFDTEFPLYLGNNITASIGFTSNDDGSSQVIKVDNKFVSFDTPYAFSVGINNFNQIDTQYQNGVELARFNHDKTGSMLHWSWLFSDNQVSTIRYGLGYSSQKNTFSPVSSDNSNLAGFVPYDREQNYPFVSVEYLQKDYRKLKNFNLINQIEDFNLGWHGAIKLGHDFSNDLISPNWVVESTISKGFQTSDNSYAFVAASIDGEDYQKNTRYVVQLWSEYFHKFNDNWGGYLKNTNIISQNQYLDQPIALGGESGVRGYPLQYQHGDRSVQFTAEARYYPHINIYKFFELGAAAFIDTGKTFGTSPFTNVDASLMTSIGFGARFYTALSSEAQVIHLDVIKPLSSDLNVNNVEFRITTKHSF